MRVEAAPRSEFAWIADRVGVSLSKDARALKAVDKAGTIRGMVAYDGWTANSVQAHIALESPLAWRALEAPTFTYPFQDAKRGVLVAIVPGWNEKSVNFVRKVGFAESCRIRDGWDVGVDLIIFEMRKENCAQLRKDS